MWQVVQRGNVQDYGMVEEFISTVSEIVPDLLNADQKAQLLLGLRARVRLSNIFMQCLAKTFKGNTGCKTAKNKQFDFSPWAVKTKNKNLSLCIQLVMGIIIETSPWNPQHLNNKSLSYCLTDGKCSWWRSLIFPRQKLSTSPASQSTSRLNTVIKHFHFPPLDPLSLLLVNNISRCRLLSVVFTLRWNHLLQVVLELCRAEQITDSETIEVHLERIKALISTWAAQVGFLKYNMTHLLQ